MPLQPFGVPPKTFGGGPPRQFLLTLMKGGRRFSGVTGIEKWGGGGTQRGPKKFGRTTNAERRSRDEALAGPGDKINCD